MTSLLAHWKTHLVGVVLLGAMVGVTFAAAVRPIVRQREFSDQLATAQAALHDQIAVARGVERELRAELARLEALGAGWEAKRGAPRTLNERLADIAAVAEAHGLRLHTVRPGDLRKGQFFTITPISIIGEGDYPRCAAFVRDLLERLPDVTIESLDLRAARSENGSATSGLMLDLAWYVDRDDARTAPIGGAG